VRGGVPETSSPTAKGVGRPRLIGAGAPSTTSSSSSSRPAAAMALLLPSTHSFCATPLRPLLLSPNGHEHTPPVFHCRFRLCSLTSQSRVFSLDPDKISVILSASLASVADSLPFGHPDRCTDPCVQGLDGRTTSTRSVMGESLTWPSARLGLVALLCHSPCWRQSQDVCVCHMWPLLVVFLEVI
jgi:hypothetical protein